MPHESRVGRRRSTTPHHISDVAIELFAAHGFTDVSVDDIARAAGIARRTLFRYYASKNAIPWGDFSTHLAQLQGLLDNIDSRIQLRDALRAALLAFNTFDESETIRHRKRMRVILQTPELQAFDDHVCWLARGDRQIRCPQIGWKDDRLYAPNRRLDNAGGRSERL